MKDKNDPVLEFWRDRLYPLIELLAQSMLDSPEKFTGMSLVDRNPEVIERLLPFLEWLHQDYFRVQTDGWEHIPASQVLLIGSHNGGLAIPDTLTMTYDWFQRFGTNRSIYALMEPTMWGAMPTLARLAAQMGAIQACPKMAIAALKQDASLLIYPGGAKDVFRPYTLRHQICLNGQHGFIKLALEENIPILPMISVGAHSTLIVLAEIHDQLEAISRGHFPWPFGLDPGVFPIYLGLPWGLAIGPLPNIPFPRPIYNRVCPPIRFDRYGKEAARDRLYVERCYQLVKGTMQAALDQLVMETES